MKLRGLFGGETELRAAEWVRMIEAEAAEPFRAVLERLAFYSARGEPGCWCDGTPGVDTNGDPEPHETLCDEIRALVSAAPAAPAAPALPTIDLKTLAEAIRLWYVKEGRNPKTGSYDQPQAAWLIREYARLANPEKP